MVENNPHKFHGRSLNTARRKNRLLFKALKKRAEVNSLIGRNEDAIRDYSWILQINTKKGSDKKSSVIAYTMISIAIQMMFSRSDLPGAQSLVRKALRKLHKKTDLQIYARGLNCLGIIYRRKGKFAEALKYFRKALHYYMVLRKNVSIASMYNNIALVYYGRGDPNMALRYYKKCLVVCKGRHDIPEVGMTLGNIGLAYQEKGQYDDAMQYYEKYYALSLKSGYKMGIGVALGDIGAIHEKKHAYDTALEYYRKALAVAEEIGSERQIGIVSGLMGYAYKKLGDHDCAQTFLNRAIAIFNKLGDMKRLGIAFLHMGMVYCDLKKFDQADQHLVHARKLLQDIGDDFHLSCVLAALSELNAVKEDTVLACSHAKKALAIVSKTKTAEILSMMPTARSLLFGTGDKSGKMAARSHTKIRAGTK